MSNLKLTAKKLKFLIHQELSNEYEKLIHRDEEDKTRHETRLDMTVRGNSYHVYVYTEHRYIESELRTDVTTYFRYELNQENK